MLPEYKVSTNVGVGVGLLLQIAGKQTYYDYKGTSLSYLGIFFIALSLVALIWGCSSYAKGKGYNQFWGLLGVLNLLGFLVLFFFPDRNKGLTTQSRRTK